MLLETTRFRARGSSELNAGVHVSWRTIVCSDITREWAHRTMVLELYTAEYLYTCRVIKKFMGHVADVFMVQAPATKV